MDHEAREEHEASPDHAVQDSDRSQPWQRLTVLDILLLPLAFALGVSLAYFIAGGDDTVKNVIWGALFGLVLVGPIVLFVQCAFRGRRQWLSLGEWLWLALTVMITLFFGMMFVPVTLDHKFGLVLEAFIPPAFLLAIMSCFLLAVIVLIGQLIGMRRDVPCRWTDFLGAAVWMLFLSLLIYGMLFASCGSSRQYRGRAGGVGRNDAEDAARMPNAPTAFATTPDP